jgi:hypothetical protein
MFWEELDSKIPPPHIPHASSFRGQSYYIRACFDVLYTKILAILHTTRLISVLGSPGVGKSLFYLYFVDRFLSEFPNQSILVSAIPNTNTPRATPYDIALLSSNSQTLRFIDETTGSPKLPKWGEIRQDSPQIQLNLYISDGLPTLYPVYCNTSVVFTTPTKDWNDRVKYCLLPIDLAEIYIPNWELDEFKDAVEVLNLPLSPDDLINRYYIFGGIPLHVLSTDPLIITEFREANQAALNQIETLDQVRDCLYGILDLDSIINKLMQYTPDSTYRNASLHPISAYVSEQLYAKTSSRTDT